MSENKDIIQRKANRPFNPGEVVDIQASKRAFSAVKDEHCTGSDSRDSSSEELLKRYESHPSLDCTAKAIFFRLEALQCPFLEEVELTNFRCMQKIIVWMEDTHIARYPKEKRKGLRSKEFLPALNEYITLFPFEIPGPDGENLLPVVAALSALAIRLYYNDHRDMLEEPVDPWLGMSVPVIKGISEDQDIEDYARALLQLLDINPPVPEIYQKLAIAADTVEGCLYRTPSSEEEKADLSELDLGWKATSDEAVDRAIRVASVLLLRRQALIQDCINSGIREMQKYSSEPKTDSKRGRVGR